MASHVHPGLLFTQLFVAVVVLLPLSLEFFPNSLLCLQTELFSFVPLAPSVDIPDIGDQKQENDQDACDENDQEEQRGNIQKERSVCSAVQDVLKEGADALH